MIKTPNEVVDVPTSFGVPAFAGFPLWLASITDAVVGLPIIAVLQASLLLLVSLTDAVLNANAGVHDVGYAPDIHVVSAAAVLPAVAYVSVVLLAPCLESLLLQASLLLLLHLLLVAFLLLLVSLLLRLCCKYSPTVSDVPVDAEVPAVREPLLLFASLLFLASPFLKEILALAGP